MKRQECVKVLEESGNMPLACISETLHNLKDEAERIYISADNNNGAEVVSMKSRYLRSFVKTYFNHADETKFFRNTKTMIREQPPVTRMRVSSRDT